MVSTEFTLSAVEGRLLSAVEMQLPCVRGGFDCAQPPCVRGGFDCAQPPCVRGGFDGVYQSAQSKGSTTLPPDLYF